MTDAAAIFSVLFVVAGSLFMILAAFGLLKLPDLFLRLAAISKASTLGMILILIGAMIASKDSGITLKMALTILFLLLAGPTASHMIGRAGYRSGSKLYSGTQVDQWRGKS